MEMEQCQNAIPQSMIETSIDHSMKMECKLCIDAYGITAANNYEKLTIYNTVYEQGHTDVL